VQVTHVPKSESRSQLSRRKMGSEVFKISAQSNDLRKVGPFCNITDMNHVMRIRKPALGDPEKTASEQRREQGRHEERKTSVLFSIPATAANDAGHAEELGEAERIRRVVVVSLRVVA